MPEKALDLFEQVSFKLTDVVYTIVFNACARLCNDRATKIGRTLLNEMSENQQNNSIILNSAIDMLMKFGDVQTAEQVYKCMKTKDIFTYGAMMKGYNLNNQSWKCFELFEEMNHKNIESNDIIWTLLIGACSATGMLHRCESVVNQIPHDSLKNIQIQCSLIHMWVNIHFSFHDSTIYSLFSSLSRVNVVHQ